MARRVMDHMDEETAAIFARFPKSTVVTPEHGALTQLYLATSPEVVEKDIRGRFFVPTADEQELNSDALDVDLQEELWAYSEKVVKEKTQK